MPFDAVFLSALLEELRPGLVGCIVDKVQQPARDTVLLTMRGLQGRRLLFSVGTGTARISLTETQPDNPQQPPMFCMLLRKYLIGARVTALEQPSGDRIALLRLSGRDSLGDEGERVLIAELMGRNSNLILTDGEGIILDCLRRVPGGEEIRRPLLPGLRYHFPELQEGELLSQQSEERIDAMVCCAPAGQLVTQWLRRTFRGLSPLLCRELAFRAYGDVDALLPVAGERRIPLLKVLLDFQKEQRETPSPVLLLDPQGEFKDYSCTPVTHYGAGFLTREEADFSALLDLFYVTRDNRARMQTAAHDLRRSVKTAADRVRRRLTEQRREYDATEERDSLRENGDIITANLWNMTKGMRVLKAEDFYAAEEGAVREIPLDPLKTPQQNAAKYYKDYNRAKTARRVLAGQLAKGEEELAYLESVADELERADSLRMLEGIRRELEESGWLKDTGKKRQKPEKSGPLRFLSPGCFEVLVGRNNLENDRLTLRTARKNDFWFHVKDLHGSHVILLTGGGRPGEADLLFAAGLAAWFSQARGETRAAVDMTVAGCVKKPAGALPGRVIYTDQRTLYVPPKQPPEK